MTNAELLAEINEYVPAFAEAANDTCVSPPNHDLNTIILVSIANSLHRIAEAMEERMAQR